MPIAEHIIIDRDENGAPRITIDGQVLQWWTLEGSIKVPAPSLQESPSMTVTFLADKVTMVNDDQVVRNLADAQVAKRAATHADRLLAAIKGEGGEWTGARAARALNTPSYRPTPERAVQIMRQLCGRGELIVANPPRGRTFRLPDASGRPTDGG